MRVHLARLQRHAPLRIREGFGGAGFAPFTPAGWKLSCDSGERRAGFGHDTNQALRRRQRLSRKPARIAALAVILAWLPGRRVND
jgi:hypothetical protein